MLTAGLVLALLAPIPAQARACPGAGKCPYRQVSGFGKTGRGIMRQPQGIAFDGGGNLYVADRWSYLVQRFNLDGAHLGQFGEYGPRQGQFATVSGLDTDAQGNLYMLDKGNEPLDRVRRNVDYWLPRVQKFDPNGRVLTSWGAEGSDGAGKDPFRIRFKGGIAVGPSSIYVSDTANHRVVRYGLDGRYQGDLGARGERGAAPGRFRHPQGLDVDPAGNLYVADSNNHRVQKFDPAGAYVGQVGTGVRGRAHGQLDHPYDVDVDPAGNIYVADNINNRIEKFDPAFQFVATFGQQKTAPDQPGTPAPGQPTPGAQTPGGQTPTYPIPGPDEQAPSEQEPTPGEGTPTPSEEGAAPGQLLHPRTVAVHPSGIVVVTDTVNDRMQTFSPEGAPLATWGETGRENGNLVSPHGIDADPSGRLVVVNSLETWIHRLSSTGSLVHKWGGHGGFDTPVGVAVDKAGNSEVTDPGNFRTKRFDPAGRLIDTTQRLSFPLGVAVDRSGNSYVAETAGNRIGKLDPTGRKLHNFRLRGSGRKARRSQAKRRGSGGALRNPASVALDGACSIYVADTGKHRVVQLSSTDGAFERSWGKRGRKRGQFREPRGIDVDGRGRVFVTDPGNARVQKFSASGRFLGAWGRKGHDLGEFVEPFDVTVDRVGSLYVSDPHNNRVQRFRGASSRGERAVPRLRVRARVLRGQDLRDLVSRGLRLDVRSPRACTASARALVDAATANRLRLTPPAAPPGAPPSTQPVEIGRGFTKLSSRGRGRIAVRLDPEAARALRRRRDVTLELRTSSSIEQADAASRPLAVKVRLTR